MARAAKWLAVAATVGMFTVLLMGATVTNTGSSEGCGKSWPLCHGEFIPEYAFETMVEYSHRLVTGVEGLLILGMSVTYTPTWLKVRWYDMAASVRWRTVIPDPRQRELSGMHSQTLTSKMDSRLRGNDESLRSWRICR